MIAHLKMREIEKGLHKNENKTDDFIQITDDFIQIESRFPPSIGSASVGLLYVEMKRLKVTKI